MSDRTLSRRASRFCPRLGGPGRQKFNQFIEILNVFWCFFGRVLPGARRRSMREGLGGKGSSSKSNSVGGGGLEGEKKGNFSDFGGLE